MEGEKKSVLASVGEERIGGAYTLRNDTEEELLREMLNPYIIRVGIKRRKLKFASLNSYTKKADVKCVRKKELKLDFLAFVLIATSIFAQHFKKMLF